MKRVFANAMRRTARLMRPYKLSRSTRVMQKAVAGFMVGSARTPMRALRQMAKAQSPVSKALTRPTLGSVTAGMTEGAQYLSRTHSSSAGVRSYKLYLPSRHPEQPKGLILMLHGCSQGPDDFAVGTHMNALAEKHDFAVAYPSQVRRNNPASCWNWYNPRHQVRGKGEPAILASLTRKLMKQYDLGRENVFVAGLSAGGAMADILADIYPEIYSAAGIHSGLARGSARSVTSAMSVMRSGALSRGIVPVAVARTLPVRRIIFQGDADGTVHPDNADRILAAAVGGDAVPLRVGKRSVRGRGYTRSDFAGSDGAVLVEFWTIAGGGHAWSGGQAPGTYTDDKGPDASRQMLRFFMTQPATAASPRGVAS
ncbi:MAG: PHB depolymerase family esterase [Salinarimonas sp.]|nr:PHB depolymerase family esterase [Salinarimonas sp.]